MIHLLLIEDDPALGQTLKERLEKEGYKVSWATSLSMARQYLRTSSGDFGGSGRPQGFSPLRLALLDVGLPDGLGFEFVEDIQKIWPIPFIFITAQASAEDRLRGYELGATEFIPKPFHLKEVLIRIKHVLENHSLDTYKLKDGTRIEFTCLRIIRADDSLQELSLKEMQILKLIIERSPQAVSRDVILDVIWGMDKFPSQRTIDNMIVRLRQALGFYGGLCIRSVRGVGYQFIDTSLL